MRRGAGRSGGWACGEAGGGARFVGAGGRVGRLSVIRGDGLPRRPGQRGFLLGSRAAPLPQVPGRRVPPGAGSAPAGHPAFPTESSKT